MGPATWFFRCLASSKPDKNQVFACFVDLEKADMKLVGSVEGC